MQSIKEYLINNHIIANNKNLAEALAISIWSFCDNDELSDKDFIFKTDDYVIFKPKGMSVTDVKLLIENFNKNYKDFSINQTPKDGDKNGKNTIFYLGIKDLKIGGITKNNTFIWISDDGATNNIRSIYMSFDVQDELFKISEKENENN